MQFVVTWLSMFYCTLTLNAYSRQWSEASNKFEVAFFNLGYSPLRKQAATKFHLTSAIIILAIVSFNAIYCSHRIFKMCSASSYIKSFECMLNIKKKCFLNTMTAELSIINARSLAHLCCTSWNILYSLRVCIILKLFVLLFYYRLKTLCKRFNTVNVLLKPWTNFEEMDFSDEQQQKVNCSHRPGNLQIQIESPCFAFTSSASIKRYMSFRWVSDFFLFHLLVQL